MSGTRARANAGIAVVVVLYATSQLESRALTSLNANWSGDRRGLRIMVWDNSPAPFASPPSGTFNALYVSDQRNPGLATAYNAALDWAVGEGCDWLVLLDQDTEVTVEYLDAVVAFVQGQSAGPRDASPVGLAFPQLRQGIRPLSPTYFPRLSALPFPHPSNPAADDRIMVLNSGSVVSVAAAKELGGFPSRYPLDALDHAFVSEMRRASFRLQPLAVSLEHHASTSAMSEMSLRRYDSMSRAETRYFSEYGTWADRAWLVVRRAVRLAQIATRQRETPSFRAEFNGLVNALWIGKREGGSAR